MSNDCYIHTSNPAASSRLWSSYTRRTLERNKISTRRAKKRSIFPCNILRRTQRQFGKPQPFQKTSSYLRFVRHIVLFPVSSANRKWNISSRDNSCRLVRYSKKWSVRVVRQIYKFGDIYSVQLTVLLVEKYAVYTLRSPFNFGAFDCVFLDVFALGKLYCLFLVTSIHWFFPKILKICDPPGKSHRTS